MSLYIYVADETLRSKYRDSLSTRRPTDSGVDLFVRQDEFSVAGHETEKLGFGIVVAATTRVGGAVPCLLMPRSSLSKTPLRLANSLGLIDAGYRGEILAAVDNRSDRPYTAYSGDRLFQICAHDFLPFTKIELVDRLEDLPAAPDDRGSGGFGSTGR